MKLKQRLLLMLKFWKLFPFLMEFFVSKDVQHMKKIFGLVLMLAYFFFPFDLIPDFMAFVGLVDDFIIAGFVIERFIKMAPRPLKEKYNLISQ